MDEEKLRMCEIFTSYDKDRIIAYCKERKIDIPKEEEAFWAGVNKVICKLFMYEETLITCKQFNESFDWLVEHGYKPLNEQEEKEEKTEQENKEILLLEEIRDLLKENLKNKM